MPPLLLALVGLGSAGRARLKALEVFPDFKLAGIVSRRKEFSTIEWDEVLATPEIKAVAISTENPLHPILTKQALNAHKHVLCDYPVAFDLKNLQLLETIAHTKKLIFHAEHIALLSSSHLDVTEQIKTKGDLVLGKYQFTGGWPTKLADPNWLGPPPFLAVSRLVQILDWFGKAQVLNSTCIKNEKAFKLHLDLKFKNGGTLELIEQRAEGLPRSRQLTAQCTNGLIEWNTKPEAESLFLKDLQWFYDRIAGTKTGPYYSSQALTQATEILAKVKV